MWKSCNVYTENLVHQEHKICQKCINTTGSNCYVSYSQSEKQKTPFVCVDDSTEKIVSMKENF